MKYKSSKINYFFVDESGDPTFYDRNGNLIVGNEGCSKILIMGCIQTEEPMILREALEELRKEVGSDAYLQKIPSFKNSSQYFHAKDDCPEIREKVFKKIIHLPFKAQLYVGRKIETLFLKKHLGDCNLFYDDLISKLFEHQLHTSEKNVIYFATRGNKARQEPLRQALQIAVQAFEKKWDTEINVEIQIFAQTSIGEPCLQIVDYVNWAVYRAFTRGEMRYFDFIRDKVSFIVDLYDMRKYPKNFYSRKNPFDANKISPV